MNMVRIALGLLAVVLADAATAQTQQVALPPLQETPYFAERVAKGELPAIMARIPQHPSISDGAADGREQGKSGGTMQMLMGDQRDLRTMTIYSYTRLVNYTEKMVLEPDILESFDVVESRIFTFHLRAGHKWSDGQPFTAEDFRYYWLAVANNKELSPEGPPAQLVVDGKPAKVEVLDAQTVRYSWDKPNPGFLPALAAANPLFLFMPQHYLQQFHADYADKDKLAALVKAARVKGWSALHERKSRQYRPENPELPTLDPWRNTTAPPSEYFVFERNPFFHRIDNAGHQLPYIDRVKMVIVSGSLVPAKAGTGESDLQARYVRFDSYTFLKEAEQRYNYKVQLWDRGEGAYLALAPNLNATDPVWRDLMRDVRFRRALSLSVNRRDINRVIFFGLAHESANTVIAESPLHDAAYDRAYTQYDPAAADALLDEIGLTKKNIDGIRYLPDGRLAEFTVECPPNDTDTTDALELIADNFRRNGIAIYARSTPLDLMRRRIRAGQTIMSLGIGLDNAMPTADMDPSALAPSNMTQVNWPKWGEYVETGGYSGEAVADGAAKRLADLLMNWRVSASEDARRLIWKDMLTINADQVFMIGIVNRIPQPVVISTRMHNVPKKAIYSFEPGAFFGIYRMDLFWLDPQAEK